MALMSVEEARQLGQEFQPRFSSLETFEASWRRCFEKLRTPSAESARRWLLEDLKSDSVMAGGLPLAEPLLPLRSSYELSDCRHCNGLRYVRRDVPVGDPEFGHAVPCEACSSPAFHDRGNCRVCRQPLARGGYLGPDTPFVPADWSAEHSAIPEGWVPRHVEPAQKRARGYAGHLCRECRNPLTKGSDRRAHVHQKCAEIREELDAQRSKIEQQIASKNGH